MTPILAYVTAGALLAGSVAGWTVRGWRADAAELDRVQAAQEMAAEQQRLVGTASAKFEAERAARETRERTVIQEVERVVEKPVYRNECLDDDGLRILSEDIDAGIASRELGATVRGPAKANEERR